MRSPAVNLVAAAADLERSHNRIAKLIYGFRDAHSVHTDLSMACDMLESVPRVVAEIDRGAKWLEHSVPALIYSAVLLYVRATKSKSDHRARFDIRSKLSTAEKTVHERLCRLRDDAFAHFGPGDAEGRAWHEEHVVIPVGEGTGRQLVAASRRLAFPPDFVGRICDHVRRATLIAQREIERKEALLVQAIDGAIDDEAFMATLSMHRIDLAELFDGVPDGGLDPDDRAPGTRSVAWSSSPSDQP